MIYTVKRIDEDLDFGCEERAKDAPVMAVVTLVDSSGEELRVKAEDALLYKKTISMKETRFVTIKMIRIPLLAIYRWKVWK